MVIERQIKPRAASNDRLKQLEDEKRKIDYSGSVMFEEILKKKGMDYHRKANGLFS